MLEGEIGAPSSLTMSRVSDRPLLADEEDGERALPGPSPPLQLQAGDARGGRRRGPARGSRPGTPHRLMPGSMSPMVGGTRGYAPLRKDGGGGEDDNDDEDGPPPGAAVCTPKGMLLQGVLLTVMTAEVLFRKANTTKFMEHYQTMLNVTLVTFACVVFFGVEAYERFVARTQTQPVTARHLGWYLVISLFDTAATYMIILSSRDVSAPLATLLSQGVIPVSMGVTWLVFRRRFYWQHMVGAAVILAGIAVSVQATVGGDHQGSNFGWSLVFFLSAVPIAVGSIFKEKIMSHEVDPAPMNTLNAFVALFQVALSLALAPAGYSLQEDRGGHGASHTYANFGHGLQCWLLGRNSPDEGAHGDQHCGGAAWAVWVHCVLVVALNVVALLVIFKGSAVMFFIASASSIPLTAIVSALPFMGSLQVSFSWLDLVATALTFGGMVLYHQRPEG